MWRSGGPVLGPWVVGFDFTGGKENCLVQDIHCSFLKQWWTSEWYYFLKRHTTLASDVGGKVTSIQSFSPFKEMAYKWIMAYKFHHFILFKKCFSTTVGSWCQIVANHIPATETLHVKTQRCADKYRQTNPWDCPGRKKCRLLTQKIWNK